jgi:hypothetical protein
MQKRYLALAIVVAAAIPAAAFAGAASMSPVVSSKLSGKSEVPKGDPDGKGLAVLHLDAKKGTVCWDFKGITGIAAPNAAHIHKGGVGKAGPVVVPFGTAYKAKGCTKAPKNVIVAIEEHPNAYYVNIHNAKYAAGALRGQLVAGMTG